LPITNHSCLLEIITTFMWPDFDSALSAPVGVCN